MDLGLKGKGVIVTGASKGIGRALALGFAAKGANVSIELRARPGRAGKDRGGAARHGRDRPRRGLRRGRRGFA